MDQVCSQLSTAASGTNPPPPPPTPPSAPEDVPPLSRKPCIPIPARYIGELGQCGQFLNQYSLVFDQQPGTHATDKARVAFIVSLLGGRASQWAVAASRLQAPFCSSFTLFSAELLKIFDQPVRGKEISKRLLSLKQGANSVADFAVNFRILAAGTGWDEAALQGVFSQGLAENIQDELAAWDDTTSLEELVSLAIRLDNRLRERRRERALRSPPAVTVPRPMSFVPTSPAAMPSPSPSEEPMQLRRMHLSQAKRLHHVKDGLILYCTVEKPAMLSPCAPLAWSDQKTGLIMRLGSADEP